MGASMARKIFICSLGLCQSFVSKSDDDTLWGECWRCGKVAGKISRQAVRDYIENDPRNRTMEDVARRAGV